MLYNGSASSISATICMRSLQEMRTVIVSILEALNHVHPRRRRSARRSRAACKTFWLASRLCLATARLRAAVSMWGDRPLDEAEKPADLTSTLSESEPPELLPHRTGRGPTPQVAWVPPSSPTDTRRRSSRCLSADKFAHMRKDPFEKVAAVVMIFQRPAHGCGPVDQTRCRADIP